MAPGPAGNFDTHARSRQVAPITPIKWLQELAVFKSRTNVALLEAQDQAARLQDEANVTQKRYDTVRACVCVYELWRGRIRGDMAKQGDLIR